ncbi:MAG: ERCC4 domain-containing protein [Candidatus Geothermarchaeales archaeon]
MGYVEHPLIWPESIAEREYQTSIAREALERNLLVVLPTGTGKTTIALLVAAEILRERSDAKILVMAPTKPLVKQHMDYFRGHLRMGGEGFVWLTGEIPPSRRGDEWAGRRVFFATPQVVLNDLLAGRLSLEDFSLLVFDEAHRAVKGHAYAKILSLSKPPSRKTRLLGLTASPGDEEHVRQVVENLRLEGVATKTRRDQDLRRYLKRLSFTPVRVERDFVLDFSLRLLYDDLKELLGEVKDQLPEEKRRLSPRSLSYTKIMEIRDLVEKRYWRGEISEDEVWGLRRRIAAMTKIDRLIGYLETYSYGAFLGYVNRLKRKASRRGPTVERWLLSRGRVREACVVIRETVEKGLRHPKVERVLRTVEEESGRSRILLFVGLREVASAIASGLRERGINAELLIGQRRRSGERGMAQRDQIEAIERFRRGEINPLIATQVGEEGLDIAECNLVVFYDNPVSAVRRIQRMGRTGRTAPGRVIFLVLRGGRDERKYWAGIRREKKAREAVSELSLEEVREDRSLLEFIDEREGEKAGRIRLVVDHREARSPVTDFLRAPDVEVSLDSLPLGDYVVSERVLVERKTVDDFAASLMDGRLFQQVRGLRDAVELPILLIEGATEDITKRIGEKSYIGAMASVLLDFRTPVVRTTSPKETALVLQGMARREQTAERREVALRPERKPLSDLETQRYIVAGLPGVDAVLASRLLERFGTVEEVFRASVEELVGVRGIGRKTAERIREILTKRYEK